jgi:hypothetical protein
MHFLLVGEKITCFLSLLEFIFFFSYRRKGDLKYANFMNVCVTCIYYCHLIEGKLFGGTDMTYLSLTLSQLMLHICRVSKTFGEWYQKTHKTEDENKLTYGGNPTTCDSCSVIDS